MRVVTVGRRYDWPVCIRSTSLFAYSFEGSRDCHLPQSRPKGDAMTDAYHFRYGSDTANPRQGDRESATDAYLEALEHLAWTCEPEHIIRGEN